VKFLQKEVLKVGAACEFAALIGTDTLSLLMAMLGEKMLRGGDFKLVRKIHM
jgi:hypothetical protein